MRSCPRPRAFSFLLFALIVLCQSLLAQESPTLTNDKASYMAGENLILSGAHWTPNETVSVVVTCENGTVLTLQGTADDAGSFSVSAAIPDVPVPDDEKGAYTVTATGETSGATAQAHFTRGHAATDGERLIDQETYWNHRLTYPTGKYDPKWMRKAAEQDHQIKRDVPHGKKRGNGNARRTAADQGGAFTGQADSG
ncbi:MAG TPA: hypothetical protein VFU76_00495, partial [Terriglobales bacterium]|nr:hypothetical protein [Terriglobales bacterium]